MRQQVSTLHRVMRASLGHAQLTRTGIIAVAATAAVIGSVGCQANGTGGRNGRNSIGATTRPAATVVESNVTSPATAAAAAAASDKMIRGSIAYPTGDARTSAILLEKGVPAEVIANKPYEYEMTVSNLSTTRLENIVIHETLPAGLKIGEKVDGATLQQAEGRMMLNIGALDAGAKKTIRVPATATASGAVTNCASVSYDSSLCMNVKVVSPTLTMTKTLPADVMLCGDIPLKISLSNNGTGTARNVKLTDTMPEGMMTKDGRSAFTLELGDLIAGETKNIELPIKLARVGAYKNTATATADDGLKAEATASVAAHQPVLLVEKSGPKQQYVGVPFSYDISVTNKGDADAKNLVITDTLPNGLVAVEASDGGKVTGGKVVWTMANLAKNTAKQLKLTVKGTEMGAARNTVSAQAECAETATVSADTQLVGIPAILLEVIDDPDPVAVGMNTNYTIIVTNQGSAVATNVKLVGELEQQMEYVSSKGATPGKLEGNRITFDQLATLAPKAKASYTVTVKAKAEGDVRFKTTLTSDQLGRPVDELESTTFYK